MTDTHWKDLGKIDPLTLVDSRLQLHYAVQLAAAVGRSYAVAENDDSHTSLKWNPAAGRWEGVDIKIGSSFCAALDPETLTLQIVNGDGAVETALPLNGQTLVSALDWLGAACFSRIATPKPLRLIQFQEPLPEHAIADGAPFTAGGTPQIAELAAFYHNADLVLGSISERVDATPVRTWPHHFDLGTLLAYADQATTIGIGLSPGDWSYAEPYWYVSPWNPPPVDGLLDLMGGGFWRNEGWIGAVLPASHMTKTAAAQERQIRIFFISACSELGLDLVQAQSYPARGPSR